MKDLTTLRQLPKIALLPQKTPLEAAHNLEQALGGPHLLIKRDDMTGLGLGGNKVRKLEYLLGDAVAQGCTVAVTTAASQSNFLRIFAACCNKVGIRPVVFMRGRADEVPKGNLLCTYLLGAELHYLSTEDPYADNTIAQMRAYAEEQEAQGNKTYLIHLGLFSGPTATVGYISGAKELFRQAAELGREPDAIYCAVGSGGTYAGLLAGARLMEKKTKIIGVSVNVDRAVLKENIWNMIERSLDLLEAPHVVDKEEITILDDYKYPGYGKVNDVGMEAIALGAKEGLLLDPVYTGKAMAALVHDVRAGQYGPQQTVVFLYTGGMPNLFGHDEEMLDYLGWRPGQSRKGE